jgi:hypothetical protein
LMIEDLEDVISMTNACTVLHARSTGEQLISAP